MKKNKFLVLAFALFLISAVFSGCEKHEYEYTEPITLKISGATSVLANSTRDYYTYYLDNGDYAWTVPADATISEGQGTSHIKVVFGTQSGKIAVTAKGKSTEIDVEVQ